MALPRAPPKSLLPPLPPAPIPTQIPPHMSPYPYPYPYPTPQAFPTHPAFLGNRPRSQSISSFNIVNNSPTGSPSNQALIQYSQNQWNSTQSIPNLYPGKKVSFDDEIKRGYLYKESKYLKSWRRRLVMIKGPYIYSYKDSINEDPTGCMDLRRCFFQEEGVRKEGKFHTFRIIDIESADPDEFWRLSAETKKEVEEWLQIMQATQEHFQSEAADNPSGTESEKQRLLSSNPEQHHSDDEEEVTNITGSESEPQLQQIDENSRPLLSSDSLVEDSDSQQDYSTFNIVNIDEIPSTFQQSVTLYKSLLDNSKWSLLLSKNNISVFCDSSSKKVLKSMFLVPTTPDQLLTFLVEVDLRKCWDPLVAKISRHDQNSKPQQDHVFYSFHPWTLPAFPFISASYLYRSILIFLVFLCVSPFLLSWVPSLALIGLSFLVVFLLSILPFSPLLSRQSTLYVHRTWGRESDGSIRYLLQRLVRSSEHPSTCELLGGVFCVKPTGIPGESLFVFCEDFEFRNRLPSHFREYLRVNRILETASSLRTFITLHLAQNQLYRPISTAPTLQEGQRKDQDQPSRERKISSAQQQVPQVRLEKQEASSSIVLPENKYSPVIKQTLQEMITARDETEDDGWVLSLEAEGMTIYRKDLPGSPITYIKGYGTFNVDARQYLDILLDANRKPEYDSMYKDGKIIEQIDSQTSIVTQAFHAIWPTSARDFLLLQHWTKLDDGSYISVGKSIESPDYPERKDHVRGQVILGGFILKPIQGASPPQTHITYVSKFDLKGNIPSRIVALIARKQPLTTVTIAKLLTK